MLEICRAYDIDQCFNKDCDECQKKKIKKMKYPVISLWQPWAQFVMMGWKTIETRTHTRFRNLNQQRILIHAGAKWDDHWHMMASKFMTQEQINQTPFMRYHTPRIICAADVHDFGELYLTDEKLALIECATKRYGLYLSSIKKIEPVIYIKGQQGIWYHETEEIY